MATSVPGPHAGVGGDPSVNGSFAADVSAFSGFEVPGAEADPDPSMSGGFWVYFQREVPLELRARDGAELPQDAGATENIKVKVLVKGEEHAPEYVRVELSSEANLWFLYIHEVDQEAFHDLQDEQRLMLGFAEYPGLLAKLLGSCLRDPRAFLGILSMQPQLRARLDFLQVLDYKFVEHLSVGFDAASEALVRDHIVYRYGRLKGMCATLQSTLSDMSALIKTRNPSLLLQFANLKASGQPVAGPRSPALKSPGGKSMLR